MQSQAVFGWRNFIQRCRADVAGGCWPLLTIVLLSWLRAICVLLPYCVQTFSKTSCVIFAIDIFKDKQPEDTTIELSYTNSLTNTFRALSLMLRSHWECTWFCRQLYNCSGERSVSKLKLTENRLRTCMTHERLVNMAVMITESEVLGDIGLTAIIDGYAIAKSRKVSGLCGWRLSLGLRKSSPTVR